MSYYVQNEELNGIEIYFDKKPSVHIREYLKAYSFKWNSNKRCWYAKNTADALEIAKAVVDEEHAFVSDDGANNSEQSKEAYYNAKIKEINDKIQGTEKLLRSVENKNISSREKSSKNKEKEKINKDEKKVEVDYVNKENIISLRRKKNVFIELSKLTLNDGKETFALCERQDSKVKQQFLISDDELREILFSYNKCKEICRKDTEAFHKNETIFEWDHFDIVFLGIEENDYEYSFEFEIKNKSEYWIRVDVEKLFICDCEFEQFGRIADTLSPKKNCVGNVSISKKKLNKQWIKKIWEYSLIEVEFHFSYAESQGELESWSIESYRIKNRKIAPDFILRTE